MAPSQQSAAHKPTLLNWLIAGVLGVVAAAAGLLLPRSLQPLAESPPLSAPLSPATEEQSSLEYEPAPLPDLPSPNAMFLRLGLGTIFVLILCVVTLWIGKRWIRPFAAAPNANAQLRLLETLPLSGRCAVYLLQAGETKVLAGVDAAGIKALLPLPQEFAGTLAELSVATNEAA